MTKQYISYVLEKLFLSFCQCHFCHFLAHAFSYTIFSNSLNALNKDYGPKEYDKSNKTLPSTQTSLLYLVNNVSQNFMSNEQLKCQHCNKTYKTETGLNRHIAKCKERDKPSDNNEHNISCTSNDNDKTASQTIKYTWPDMGNTIWSNTFDRI